MKPQTLLCFLVFLMLWGADEALASPWLHRPARSATPRQEVFPMAFRYREHALRQARPAPDSGPGAPAQPQRIGLATCEPLPAPAAADRLYVFMSLHL
jgi:hypothetical protein